MTGFPDPHAHGHLGITPAVMADGDIAHQDLQDSGPYAVLAAGDDTPKGTKYLWLFSAENLPDKHRPKFEALKEMNLRVGKAWSIKESLRELWEYTHTCLARRFFKKWYARASHSRLEPVKKMTNMIKAHIDNVLTYCRHQVTNAVTEGLNSKIMAVKRRACGYRNKEHFKTAIYFFCGGLNLYPL